jgi:hypothetical protein
MWILDLTCDVGQHDSIEWDARAKLATNDKVGLPNFK